MIDYQYCGGYQFVLEKLIGKGGSSKVYLAKHIETNSKVAIKLLRNDKWFAKAKGTQVIEEEHNRMKTIEGHPNILKSYCSNSAGIMISKLEYSSLQKFFLSKKLIPTEIWILQ